MLFLTFLFHCLTFQDTVVSNLLGYSTVKLFHLLLIQTIKCLLIYPNPDSALNEEAGKLLQEHYDEYFKRAQMFTSIYAKMPSKQDEDAPQDATSKRKCIETDPNVGKKKKDKKGLKRL